MDYDRQLARLKKRIEFLERELYTDELTRILNRRGLMALLEPLVEAVAFELKNPEKRQKFTIRAISIVFVDIDFFKKVNDTFGHAAGDEALKKVAALLRENVRGLDVVGRYGGEEMILGLVGATASDGQRIAETIRQKIETTPIVLDFATMQITASFGVAELKKGMSFEQVLAAADKALYEAKKSGRNKVVVAK